MINDQVLKRKAVLCYRVHRQMWRPGSATARRIGAAQPRSARLGPSTARGRPRSFARPPLHCAALPAPGPAAASRLRASRVTTPRFESHYAPREPSRKRAVYIPLHSRLSPVSQSRSSSRCARSIAVISL